MITMISNNGDIVYGVKTFVLDTPDDVKDLPDDVLAGSTAIILTTGDVKVINSKGEWLDFN